MPQHPGRLLEPLTGRSWSPDEVLQRVGGRVALYEKLGLRRGERVFLHYGNNLEFFVDLLAIWHLGGCAVPVDARLTPFEVATLVRSARPAFSVWRESPDPALARELSDLGTRVLEMPDDEGWTGSALPRSRSRLEDEALILFTSGTTGNPKGVVHTHRTLQARWASLGSALGLAPYRRTLCLLPTHFGHGLICNCLFPWLGGQDLHVLPPFRADLLVRLGEVVDRHRITFLSSVPTVWRLAIKTARPPEGGSLVRVHCGSAPLSANLWRSVQEWAGTRDVKNAYGITETGSWLAGTPDDFAAPEDGLIGVAWGGTLRVMPSADPAESPTWAASCATEESGHVWIRTPALMKGYLDRDDLTDAVVTDGWFCTGDIGVMDERGQLYLRGREREEINKAGMKVHPGDVDAVVERFPDTLDVCTFAISDALLGEDVGVAVVLPGASDETLLALRAWAGEHLAAHQLPKRWYVLDEVPRTSRGKVNRAERRATLRGAQARRLQQASKGLMELRTELLSFLEESGISLPEGFDDDTPLLSSGVLDSLALFNLVLWIEEKTGRSLDPTKMDIVAAWDSVRMMLRYVEGGGEDGSPAPRRARVGWSAGRIRIEPYGPEHKDAVARFQTGLWSPDVDGNRRYLEWKYEANPYADGPRIYLALDGGELVGMRGFYSSRWQVGHPTRELDLLVADDLLVRQDRRDEGIVTAVMEAAFHDLRDQGIEYVLNLSGGVVTILGSLAMGWRSAGSLGIVGRRSAGQRTRLAVRDRMLSLRFVWRYARSTWLQARSEREPMARFDRSLGTTASGGVKIELTDTPRIDDMAALIGELGHDGRMRHVRDAAFFEWRFRHPFYRYRFAYAGGDRLDGFLVLKWPPARPDAGARVEIVDLEGRDGRVSTALLETVIRAGRFPELVTWRATHADPVVSALDRLGFRPVDLDRAAHGWPCVLVRPVDDARLDEDWMLHGTRLLDPSSWDMRMLYTMAG